MDQSENMKRMFGNFVASVGVVCLYTDTVLSGTNLIDRNNYL